jgi:predicted oxidoreductase
LLNPKEVANTIQNLIQSGKILSFGVSNFTPSQINLLKTLIPVSYNQIEISITEHSPLTNGSLDYLMEHNIQTMSWSPLGTIFTTKNEQNDRILQVLKQLTDKYNADEATLALAWILSHPANILPVIGSTNPERIAKLANSPKIRLDLQDWFLIYTASLGKPVA